MIYKSRNNYKKVALKKKKIIVYQRHLKMITYIEVNNYIQKIKDFKQKINRKMKKRKKIHNHNNKSKKIK